MYVCICNAVTEKDIHKQVDEGANTLNHLEKSLCVGANCGACKNRAQECLDEYQEKSLANMPVVVGL